MSRRRRKKKGAAKTSPAETGDAGLFGDLGAAVRVAAALRSSFRVGGTMFYALLLGVFGLGAVFGLETLRHRMDQRPEFHPPMKLVLDNPPAWVVNEDWAPRILSSVTLPEDAAWSEGDLLREIHGQLTASGWVSAVHRVWQEIGPAETAEASSDVPAGPVRYIRLDCTYRRPIAMIYSDGFYIAVDREGYRLPGDYPEISTDTCGWWLVIRGLTGELPEVGHRFSADNSEDAVQAVRLAAVLTDQDFASRLQSIDVSNFRGRRDRFKPHIVIDKLRQPGEPSCGFYWGSAIGEEVAELAVADKLRNMGLLLAQGKPIPGKYMDISTQSGVIASFDAPMASAQSPR